MGTLLIMFGWFGLLALIDSAISARKDKKRRAAEARKRQTRREAYRRQKAEQQARVIPIRHFQDDERDAS